MRRDLTLLEANLLERITALRMALMAYASGLEPYAFGDDPLPNIYSQRIEAAILDLRATVALAILDSEDDPPDMLGLEDG